MSSKIKIAMVLDKYFPSDARVENEAQVLIANGYDVFLFCFNKNESAQYNYNGINVFSYKFSKYLFNKLTPLAFTFPFYHFLIQSRVNNFLKRVKPNIIHIHDMVLAENIESDSIPIVLDLHEDRPAIMSDYSHVNKGIGKWLINLKKWEKKQIEFITKATKVIVVTEIAKQNISAIKSSEDICVVPNSVDLDVFLNYPIDSKIIQKYSDSFTILYVGATGIRRGTDILIKAAALLKEKIKKIKIVMVGSSRDDKYLKQLATNLNIQDIVDFEGWQKFSRLPSYIKASTVCVSPLKRNKHHDSTFANKLFQYMAFNKPLIVSDSTAQANLVEEIGCGLIHSASNPEDLADKIFKLYGTPQLCTDYGNKGKMSLEKKYQWSIISNNLIQMYKHF